MRETVLILFISYFPVPQPRQREPGCRHQEPSRQGPLGQVEARLDDGLGEGQEAQGQAQLPGGAREDQELRLGRVEEEVPQVPPQQEEQGHRPLQEARRGRRRVPHQVRKNLNLFSLCLFIAFFKKKQNLI